MLGRPDPPDAGGLTSAPISILAGGLSGALIAFAARRPIMRMTDPLRTRYGAVPALFGAGLLGPAAVALYAMYPDWFLMYFANPRHLSAPILFALMFALHALAPVAGYLLMHRLLVTERARFIGIGAALLVLFVAAGLERLGAVAYYDAFHSAGPRIALFDSPLVLALGVLSAAWVGFLGFATVAVHQHVVRSELLPIRSDPSRSDLSRSLSSSSMPGSSGSIASVSAPREGDQAPALGRDLP